MKKTTAGLFRRIDIVLVRPIRPANIGAAARAMKNMGFPRLILVDPCDPKSSAAYQMAYGAQEILDRARVVKTLPQAVSSARLVVGTTVRHRKGYGRPMPLHQAAPEIFSRSQKERIAIVFGSERTGLTNDEIGVCQRIIRIPTAQLFPSLNLGHAVMVVLYELFLASSGRKEILERTPATAGELEYFYADLEQVLTAIGFVKGRQGRFILSDLRRVFGRSDLDAREVRILRGVFRQVRWAQGQKKNLPEAD